MKNKLTLFAIAFSSIVMAQNQTQGVSIANDDVSPGKDAILDVKSSTKGVLIPRVRYYELQTGGALDPQSIINETGQDGLLVYVIPKLLEDDNQDPQEFEGGYWYFDAGGTDQVTHSPNTVVNPPRWRRLNDKQTWSLDHLGNIHNSPTLKKVGVGLETPLAKFHIFEDTEDEIFIAESDKQAFGLYDVYNAPSVGTGNFLVHKSLFNNSTYYFQLDQNDDWVLALGHKRNTNGVALFANLAFEADLGQVSNYAGQLRVAAGNNLNLVGGTTITSNKQITHTSDSLLKTNIVPITNNLSRLKRLIGYSYEWKSEPVNNRKSRCGFMAQNVQREFPSLVETTTVQELDSLGNVISFGNYLGVKYTGLIPVIVEAMKEQSTIIDQQAQTITTLDSLVNALQSNYTALEARVTALEP